MALHSSIWYYEADHGQLPAQLTDLVPKYLKQADLNAPKPYSGGPMFQLVRPQSPTAQRRMKDDLLVSIPFASEGKKGKRLVYAQEDGEVDIRKAKP
ncbi:MAG: hypothetical protein ACI8T1_001711 [Verrucomicrobiales bacterium]|jgi:hypothetical protein